MCFIQAQNKYLKQKKKILTIISWFNHININNRTQYIDYILQPQYQWNNPNTLIQIN